MAISNLLDQSLAGKSTTIGDRVGAAIEVESVDQRKTNVLSTSKPYRFLQTKLSITSTFQHTCRTSDQR